jgi:hypothetical protein
MSSLIRWEIEMAQRPQLLLAHFFRRNGCIRLPNYKRRKREGQKYKKGYELRLVARTANELKQIRHLLRQTGFTMGKPYQKGRQIVQPIYGKWMVDRFRKMLTQVKA